MNEAPFDKGYSKYYNLLYSDKDYRKEVDYVDGLLKRYQPSAKRLLEYGSGTGGHGVLLNEKEYQVFGIERSAEMASVARQRGLKCEVGDITDFKLSDKFDACISLFHVISYINDNESLIQVFKNTKSHIHDGGHFIFDVWFTPAVLQQIPETRVKKIENDEIEVLRIATPAIDHLKNVVGVNYHIVQKDKQTGQYLEFKELHNMRHFGVPEIDLLAKQTGFTLVGCEEFLTGAEPSGLTWGVSFILKSI
jgi:SAM-dependent methyltransferase